MSPSVPELSTVIITAVFVTATLAAVIIARAAFRKKKLAQLHYHKSQIIGETETTNLCPCCVLSSAV